jgi:DNA-binding MarR family transcriptional regulator
VRRESDAKDKRIMRLSLTADGEALLMQALKIYSALIERVMAQSSHTECDRMGDQMRRIEDMLKNG